VLVQLAKEHKELTIRWKRKQDGLSAHLAKVEDNTRKMEAMKKLAATRGEEVAEVKPPQET
jgi:two-component sensor histidine kinase